MKKQNLLMLCVLTGLGVVAINANEGGFFGGVSNAISSAGQAGGDLVEGTGEATSNILHGGNKEKKEKPRSRRKQRDEKKRSRREKRQKEQKAHKNNGESSKGWSLF